MAGLSLASRRVAVTAVVLGALSACGGTAGILGTPPTYRLGGVSDGPNATAIVTRIWVPDLDEYFDPQGLAVARSDVFVSGFVGTGLTENKGRCRIYRIDRVRGTVRDRVELSFADPADKATYARHDGETRWCGHAGGLAVNDARLFLTDTRLVFVTTLDVFAHPPPPDPPKLKLVNPEPVTGMPATITGGLAAADAGGVWIGGGVSDHSASLYRFDAAMLEGTARRDTAPPALQPNPQTATACIPLANDAQGAALDPHRDGTVWIARSDASWGRLERIDAAGRLLARYEIPAATEGIAFDDDGLLWGVSEAGARRVDDSWVVRLIYPLYRLIVPFHPVVFALDPSRLRGERFEPPVPPPIDLCVAWRR